MKSVVEFTEDVTRMMELHYQDGTHPPEAIGPTKLSIGSSPRCDIHLAGSEGVYPVHAHAWSDKDSIILSLKIGAKVMVNDDKILLRAVLHHGDKILIGDTVMQVRESDIQMGFRDKMLPNLTPPAIDNIEQPSLNLNSINHGAAIPAQQAQQTNPISSPSEHITEACQSSAISRQQQATDNGDDTHGLHIRDINTATSQPKIFSRQRKLLTLLLFGVGTLLFANLLLAAF
ncbi:FHA domain-containing protein [Saccharophagus degradans]|uniref:FHA domain-containing protein n=1 Tax=Saccharophagus degradans TaxID=86304 RepID=UPI0024781FFD|nr:FHA domain-containing protein [Saccharophagus degradans]WGO99026.1 FHA domain-containing protein [Saccharophagus degradans]